MTLVELIERCARAASEQGGEAFTLFVVSDPGGAATLIARVVERCRPEAFAPSATLNHSMDDAPRARKQERNDNERSSQSERSRP